MLMSKECVKHVRALCSGENVRREPDAWQLLLREAPVIAKVVVTSGLYVCGASTIAVYNGKSPNLTVVTVAVVGMQMFSQGHYA